MKLTCVTAVFNAVKSGNRENLIRCVRSVAALNTEHEHLIYDGASTDGTVELLRELEREINEADAACSDAERTPRLRVISEPDDGIYNALNKGVRDAQGEWFYVLGCDDYVFPEVMDDLLKEYDVDIVVAPIDRGDGKKCLYHNLFDLHVLFWTFPYSHQGVIMKTAAVRKYNGFDERFKVCADWQLMLKCHRDGLRHVYVKRPLAYFAYGGLSCSGVVAWDDVTRVLADFFGLTENEAAEFRRRGYMRLKYCWQYLKHPDVALRLGAWGVFPRMAYAWGKVAAYPLLPFLRYLRRKLRS